MKTIRRLFLETAADDAVERPWQIRIDVCELRRIFFEDGVHRLDVRIAAEGTPSGHHFVEDRTEREDVGPVIERLRADLLRRYVADSAHHHADCRVCDPGFSRASHGDRAGV